MLVGNRTICALIAAISLLLAADSASAQLPLHFVGGVMFADVSGEDVDDPVVKSKTGVFAGLGTSFALSPTVSVAPYVVYAQRGWKESDDGEVGDLEISVDYIDIPVFLLVTFPLGTSAGLTVGAAPRFSFSTSCDVADSETTVDCDEIPAEQPSLDLGGMGGAGIGFALGPSVNASAGGGYDISFTNMFDTVEGADFEARHRGFFLFAQVSLLLGG